MSGYDVAESLGAWAWRANWQAAALAGGVGLVLWLCGKRISPGWRFALWALVLVRLVMPAVVEVRWGWAAASSRVNAGVRELTEAEFRAALSEADAQGGPKGSGALGVGREVGSGAAKAPDPVSWTTRAARRAKSLAVMVWIAGMALFAIRLTWASIRLSRAVGRTRPVTEPRVLKVIESCCVEMGVRRFPEARELPAGAGPALVGFVRPKILLPVHVTERMGDDELRLIVLHELAHVRRRDVLVNWLATLITIVHWANPAVWIVAWRMRTERELACDEMVLRARAGAGDAGRAYAATILKLVEALSGTASEGGVGGGANGWSGRAPAAVAAAAAAVPHGAVALLEGKAQLQRRLQMIARFDSASRRWPAVAAVTLGLVVGGVVLTGATTRAADPVETNNPATPGGSAAVPATGGGGAPTPAPVRSRGGNASGHGEPGVASDLSRGTPGTSGTSRLAAMKDWSRASSPDDDAVNARTAQRLRKMIDKVDFNGVGLSDVIEFVRDAAGIDVLVEWGALEQAGVPKDAPVTLRLRDPASVDAVLTLIFRSMGGMLRYELDRGVVVVTTADRQAQTITRVYDVSDLLGAAAAQGGGVGRGLDAHEGGATPVTGGGGFASPEAMTETSQLIGLITSTIHPSDWMSTGGSIASIATFKNKLVVKAPEPIHKEVSELLEMLREKPAQGAPRGAAPAEKPH